MVQGKWTGRGLSRSGGDRPAGVPRGIHSAWGPTRKRRGRLAVGRASSRRSGSDAGPRREPEFGRQGPWSRPHRRPNTYPQGTDSTRTRTQPQTENNTSPPSRRHHQTPAGQEPRVGKRWHRPQWSMASQDRLAHARGRKTCIGGRGRLIKNRNKTVLNLSNSSMVAVSPHWTSSELTHIELRSIDRKFLYPADGRN